jgi:ABC-type glutathione transport system ATPase component
MERTIPPDVGFIRGVRRQNRSVPRPIRASDNSLMVRRLPVFSTKTMTSNKLKPEMENKSNTKESGERKNAPLLEVRNLKKYFTSNKKSSWGLQTLGLASQEHVRAVDDISFTLNKNETLGVVGESGCGKSTLGRTILRLLEPTEGEILYKGENLDGISKKEMRKKRANIQMIFQDPTSVLNPRMKVRSLLAEPLQNFYDWTKKKSTLELTSY